jgi:hypothetical protein
MLYPCDQCGSEVEFDTIVGRLCPQCREQSADEISNNEVESINTPHKIAYRSFFILAACSILSALVILLNLDASGFVHPATVGFFIVLPLSIPILLAGIFGPVHSLFFGWREGYLMSMTGFSFVLVFSLIIFGSHAVAISLLLLAYGVACITICINKFLRTRF